MLISTTANSNSLTLARSAAQAARDIYESTTDRQLRRQSQPLGQLAALVRFDPTLGKYEAKTIHGDRVWGDFYGINPPRLGKHYAYSRAIGSDYGFFTDA
ncbi:hypothetical protein Pse7367_3958 (plasmid) [Thalassoporum mexicanum PCC 7367]|uniref:hypothetical protein n=1 Tax=Thalassoporum mexicanum TaxID=3457544 RepID=UPI00029FF15B|nr:hypothetical protein [Pseudanabaena sp. PCC 7367]AFY72173.1 hypothetical protein Pse7367_3958 [Pseudanabaena sp. PCC 7367]